MFVLIASRDDFLLEEAVERAIAELGRSLGGVEPEYLPDDATPEALLLEVQSPSLFASSRLLVVREVRVWLDETAPPEAPPVDNSGDVGPLVDLLGRGGLPTGVGVVLASWCDRKPKGPLVKAAAAAGRFEWIGLPDPPKPWESGAVSADQRQALRRVLARFAAGVRLSTGAEELLFERLGFAPRLLVQEVAKLAAAAGGGEVDVELVRRLTFPRERSVEALGDALLERSAEAVADVLAAAAAGIPVRDFRGQRIDAEFLPNVLFNHAARRLDDLLYLRRVAAAAGATADMDPACTGGGRWYKGRFTAELLPRLEAELARDPSSPLARRGRPPSAWQISVRFAAAGRYSDRELIDALADAGRVEADLRGLLALEALSAWLTTVVRSPAAR